MHGNGGEQKLSDIYVQQLAESGELNHAADAENDPDQRRILREQAGTREHHAAWIAHCIALYGDLKLSAAVALLDDPTMPAVNDGICGGENPWLRGLDLLKAIYERPATQKMDCSCDLRTKLVGDGCQGCNPALAAELEAEQQENSAS